jgi:hypothetical protein
MSSRNTRFVVSFLPACFRCLRALEAPSIRIMLSFSVWVIQEACGSLECQALPSRPTWYAGTWHRCADDVLFDGFFCQDMEYHWTMKAIKRSVSWDITRCNPLKVSWRFGTTCRLHLQSVRISKKRNQRESRRQEDILPPVINIVISLLKARIVYPEKSFIARQWSANTFRRQQKHVPTSTIPGSSLGNSQITFHSTMEEFLDAVFSMRSVPRLYSEKERQKGGSQYS